MLTKLLSLAAVLALGPLPLRAALLFEAPADTNTPPASASISVGWNPSASTNAIGYFVCYGFASSDCTNRLDVGNATSVTLSGLETNVTYYVTVVAYDGVGKESPPSNEIAFSLPVDPSATEAPTLQVQLQGGGGSGESVRLTFQADAGWTYQIQASEDLRQWATISTTNCALAGVIAFAADPQNYPQRFYRVLRQ